MSVRTISALSLLFLLPHGSPAGDLYGPMLGLVGGVSGGTIRPLRGIPGAATIGESIDLGADAAVLTIAQSRAVLTTATGIRVVSIQPDGTLAAAAPDIPAVAPPAAIAFSPSGQSAAIYDSDARVVWLVRDTAVRIDASRLPDAIDLLAASDRAASLIAGTVRADRQSVFVLDGQGGYRLLTGFTEVTTLTFLGSGAGLAISDRGQHRILLVRDPLSGSAPETLLQLDTGAPLHIASSVDGAQLAVVASAGQPDKAIKRTPVAGPARPPLRPKTVAGLLRISDGTWTPVECNCQPSGLWALSGNAVFRLTQRIDQPLWILDGDSGGPRAAFIPAVPQ